VPDLDLSDTSGFWNTMKRWMGLGSAREVAG